MATIPGLSLGVMVAWVFILVATLVFYLFASQPCQLKKKKN